MMIEGSMMTGDDVETGIGIMIVAVIVEASVEVVLVLTGGYVAAVEIGIVETSQKGHMMMTDADGETGIRMKIEDMVG
jgi:hypothetical protein